MFLHFNANGATLCAICVPFATSALKNPSTLHSLLHTMPEEYTILEKDKVIISHEAQRITLSVLQPETFTEAGLDLISETPWIEDGFGYDATARTVFFDVPENTGAQREATMYVNCGGFTATYNLTIIQRAKPRRLVILDRHGKQVLLAGTQGKFIVYS